MSEWEASLPHGFMGELGSAELELPRNELEVVFGVKIPLVVEEYMRILSGDSPHLKVTNLSKEALQDLNAHLRGLEDLRQFSQDFAQDPRAFEVRVTDISRDERIAVARLRRASDAPIIPVGAGKYQIQYSFFSTIPEIGVEREEALRNASMQGVSPAAAIRRADREANSGYVTLNSIGLYRESLYARPLVTPRPGIRVRKEGPYIDLDGILMPGAEKPHALEIKDEGQIDFTPEQFDVLQAVALRLAGFNPNQPPQSPVRVVK